MKLNEKGPKGRATQVSLKVGGSSVGKVFGGDIQGR
jgi:hypothetical protein